MVGVVVDAQRMNRTKSEWQELFLAISRLANRPISELHAKDVLAGNKEWRDIDPSIRQGIVDAILDWLANRRHSITFAAVDRKRFRSLKDHRLVTLSEPWMAAAFHVVLSLQKAHKSEKNNKGHTVLVFDSGKDMPSLAELVRNPPDWSDSYYGHTRSKKKECLDQIIDIPFFADSRHAVLIQIADLIGYILRRHVEFQDYGEKERYFGERQHYAEWVTKIAGMLMNRSTRYPSVKPCSTAQFYRSLAPQCLVQMDNKPLLQ